MIPDDFVLNGRLILLLCGLGSFTVVMLALLIFVTTLRKMKRIEVPEGATFAETLMVTPFLVVLFIDLLDLGLDVLAVPFVWVFLDRLGLKALRGVSAVEALIPMTQLLPTMTVCWLGVRFLGYAPPVGMAGKYIIDEVQR